MIHMKQLQMNSRSKHVRRKTKIKHAEENIEEHLHDLGMDKDYLNSYKKY